MTAPRCVITGCYVQVGAGVAVCDLHEIGDCWILVCNINAKGETKWHYGSGQVQLAADSRVVFPLDGHFDKRGIMIIHKKDAILSDAARKYIEESGL